MTLAKPQLCHLSCSLWSSALSEYIWIPEATVIKGKIHLWMWCGLRDPAHPLKSHQGWAKGPFPRETAWVPPHESATSPCSQRPSELTWLNCCPGCRGRSYNYVRVSFWQEYPLGAVKCDAPWWMIANTHWVPTLCQAFATCFTCIMSSNLQIIPTGWVLLLLCFYFRDDGVKAQRG